MADTTEPYITWTPPTSSSLFYVTSTTAHSSTLFRLISTAVSSVKPTLSSKHSTEYGTSSASSPISGHKLTSKAVLSSSRIAQSSKFSGKTDTISASLPISTVPAQSAQREYPCVYRGGPKYTSGFCDCTAKVSKHTYHTTASASSGNCAIYTAFPGTITPITLTPDPTKATPVPSPVTLTQPDGEVDAYPLRSIDIG